MTRAVWLPDRSAVSGCFTINIFTACYTHRFNKRGNGNTITCFVGQPLIPADWRFFSSCFGVASPFRGDLTCLTKVRCVSLTWAQTVAVALELTVVPPLLAPSVVIVGTTLLSSQASSPALLSFVQLSLWLLVHYIVVNNLVSHLLLTKSDPLLFPTFVPASLRNPLKSPCTVNGGCALCTGPLTGTPTTYWWINT